MISDMNLYKIIIKHFSPKDSKEGIVCLVLAENAEAVYEWLKTEPEINDISVYNGWEDSEETEDDRDVYDDDEDYKVIGRETWREYMIRIGGEINDEDFDNADAYYGNTIYGWELVKEDCTTDYSELISLNLLVQL